MSALLRCVGRGVAGLALAVAAAGTTGCASDNEVPANVIIPGVATGTLVVDWTIELTTDPAFCSLASVTSIQVHVVTIDGLDAGTFEQSCSAFSTSIGLAADRYTATATLIDSLGQARTTDVVIAPFTIFGNDILHTPIDFPSNSFF